MYFIWVEISMEIPSLWLNSLGKYYVVYSPSSSFPMGASCGGHNINEQEYYDVGLEPNHAYSILDVRQINNRERWLH